MIRTGRKRYELLHGGRKCAKGAISDGAVDWAGAEARHAGLARGNAAVAAGRQRAGFGRVVYRIPAAAVCAASPTAGRWSVYPACACRRLQPAARAVSAVAGI